MNDLEYGFTPRTSSFSDRLILAAFSTIVAGWLIAGVAIIMRAL